LHGWQLDAPEVAENFPPVQLVHTVASEALWKLPAAQLLHALATASEYWPATQLEQLALPRALWNLPAPQFRHTDAPVAPW